MTIVPCASKQTDSLLAFVLPHEKMAVGFVSHIMRGNADCFLVMDGGRTYGAFSFSAGGQIFHCLPDAHSAARAELLRALTAFFRGQKNRDLFNIIGEENGTELIRQAIAAAWGKTTRHEQAYVLLEKIGATEQVDSSDCVRCVPEMIEALLPLQIAYEREEIFWEGEPYNPNVTRLAFLRALRTQQVFALVKNGRYVAKGGTNAQGKRYAQLGGVFTVPSERKKGYATELLRHVTQALHRQGKDIVLFAKKDNVAALRLYEKIGCKNVGSFEIVYY